MFWVGVGFARLKPISLRLAGWSWSGVRKKYYYLAGGWWLELEQYEREKL